MDKNHQAEIADGERFEFGANWKRFLNALNEERIALAEKSLRDMLGIRDFAGKTFLDIGSGSGLSSLAARRLGATVHSIDYDPQSVACTRELKKRYFPKNGKWRVEEASALNQEYLSKLGLYDVVYSWGVLHHTGAMWKALGNIGPLVTDGGLLFVSIYNDQGWISRYWRVVKRCYANNALLRWPMLMMHLPYLFALRFFVRAVTGRLALERGMSLWYDMVDWVGGYPFEVARPEEIFQFYRDRGFNLVKFKTCAGRHGCNEFVFAKVTDSLPTPNELNG
jgi:2-polyprenyl-6-hydroxyphenyl methylase/3-demethylubiquinone-9 3-methyltransferase